MAIEINRSITEILTIKEIDGKTFEFISSDDDPGVRINSFPVDGGDDEISINLGYDEILKLIEWLKSSIGED